MGKLGKRKKFVNMMVEEENIPNKIKEYRDQLIDNMTTAETRFGVCLFLIAATFGFEHETQVVHQNPETKKYYIVDFAVPFHKFIFEIDGPSHLEESQIEKDAERDAMFEKCGYKLFRIKNPETKKAINTLKYILKCLYKTSHSAKAYSYMKKIDRLIEARNKLVKSTMKDINKSFENAIINTFNIAKIKEIMGRPVENELCEARLAADNPPRCGENG